MRGLRRQQGKLKAARVVRVWRAAWHPITQDQEYLAPGGLAERYLIKTRQSCSCLGCGNRRRHEGISRQERKARDAAMAQMADVMND
jgi:hypothetical protein